MSDASFAPGAPTRDRPPLWKSAPPALALEAATVDVWRLDLDGPGDQLAALLSDEERDRAERLADDRDRSRWSDARGGLRMLLGRYLQCDPRELRFTSGRFGKPALAEQRPRCFFNLSHSANLGLYAFSADGEVGIDAEVARRQRDQVALAARVFGDTEARRLRGLAPALREQEFLRLWVRHEALLKCHGSGLGGERRAAEIEDVWIAELDLAELGTGEALAAAVAVARGPSALRCWDASWH